MEENEKKEEASSLQNEQETPAEKLQEEAEIKNKRPDGQSQRKEIIQEKGGRNMNVYEGCDPMYSADMPATRASRVASSESSHSNATAEILRNLKYKKAFGLAATLPYYWNSLLESDDDLRRLLVKENTCLLRDVITDLLRNSGKIRFELCVMSEGVISKHVVKFAASTLIIHCSGNIELRKYISRKKLETVNKPFLFVKEQIGDTSVEWDHELLDYTFQMGSVTCKGAVISDQIELPVIQIHAKDVTQEQKIIMMSDIRSVQNFNCRFIHKLVGTVITNTDIYLLLEGCSFVLLAEHIRNRPRRLPELSWHSAQLASALVYLSREGFVHKKLSLDVCFVTPIGLLKLACFGLSTGIYPKNVYANDPDRCRWLPWECLPDEIGKETPSPYDLRSIVYTYGTIVWSIFHEAGIPYENETPKELKSRALRSVHQLEIETQLTPDSVKNLILDCWSDRSVRKTISQIVSTHLDALTL